MKRHLSIMLVSLLAVPGWALAQKEDGPPVSAGEKFDIRFPGGSVEEFVGVVQQQSRGHLNILVPEALESTPVPELDLRGVSFSGLAELLRAASANAPGGELIFENLGEGWVFRLEPGASARVTRVYAINDLLERYQLEDLLALIQVTLVMDARDVGGDGEVRFHEETKALLLSHTLEHQKLVESALTQLREAMNSQGQQASVEALVEEQENLKEEVFSMEMKLRRLAEKRAEIEQLYAGHPADDSGNQQDPIHVATLLAEREVVAIRSDILKERLKTLLRSAAKLEAERRRAASRRSE